MVKTPQANPNAMNPQQTPTEEPHAYAPCVTANDQSFIEIIFHCCIIVQVKKKYTRNTIDRNFIINAQHTVTEQCNG